MVAIRDILTLIFTVGVISLSAQEIKPRIAGLEDNKDYMALLGENDAMCKRVDSLTMSIKVLREQFVEDGERRKELSERILQLESEMFALKSEHSRLIDKINTIEQSWLVVNMNNSAPQSTPQSEEVVIVPNDARKYADLTRNAYFRLFLSSSDYAALRKAQRYESSAAQLLKAFEKSHRSLETLRAEYIATDRESAADSLMRLFLNRSAECNVIADSLATTWSFVFDNKTYVYDMLFDKENRQDMLHRAESKLFTMRQNIDREQGVYMSDALVDYAFQKRCVVDYEMDVAAVLDLQDALDSLSLVRKGLEAIRYDFKPIEIKRRYFLDYAPLTFPTNKYVYTSKNPMPKCVIYENGEMYRIKLGEFSERQPLSKFRGLEPVAYLRSEDGKWIYYAGGYPTVEALEKHLQTVKKLGFRTADVAAWIDGTYAGSRVEIEELKSKSYTIEISGADALPENVRRVIEQMSEGNELSRVGKSTYLVTGFRSREAAELVVRGIVSADSSLKVAVAEAQ